MQIEHNSIESLSDLIIRDENFSFQKLKNFNITLDYIDKFKAEKFLNQVYLLLLIVYNYILYCDCFDFHYIIIINQ